MYGLDFESIVINKYIDEKYSPYNWKTYLRIEAISDSFKICMSIDLFDKDSYTIALDAKIAFMMVTVGYVVKDLTGKTIHYFSYLTQHQDILNRIDKEKCPYHNTFIQFNQQVKLIDTYFLGI